MNFTLLIGVSGATLLLVGFACQQFGSLKSGSVSYHMLNALGAGLLTLYSLLLHSVPFVVLEGVWMIVALWYLLRKLVGKEKTR
jgi:hypothetical protein